MSVKAKRKRKHPNRVQPAKIPRLVEARPASREIAPRRVDATAQTEQVAPEGFQRHTQVVVTLCAILATATFAVYFRALQSPFVNYDDPGYVVENPSIGYGLTAEAFRWALTSTYEFNWHPLTWLSHMLDVQLFGLNPTGHHLSSVLMHVVNALLLFLLLARATGSRGRSLLVAFLFGIHPFNVESVVWISERKNVLCMFFILLTLAAYGWYAQRPRRYRYFVVALLFVLALASKPMAVTLPFALLLIDFWPLQRVESLTPPSGAFPVSQKSIAQLILEKLPLLALSVGSSVITMIAQRPAVSTSTPWLARFLNATYSYAAYVLKAFWPANFSVFYPYEAYRLALWEFLLCLIFLAAVTLSTLRNRSHLYLPIGWFWFLGTLVPMIGLIQVGDQGMADRYAYLPLIGVFVIAVWGASELAEWQNLNLTWRWVLASLVIAALSGITWRQVGIWRSSRDLWFNAIAVTKDNYVAEDFAGLAVLAENYEKTGANHSDDATKHFKNAVRLNPNDALSRLNLGTDFQELGQLHEAIEQYQAVLKLTDDPGLLARSLHHLATASQQLGDFAAARQYDLRGQDLESKVQYIRVTSDESMLSLGRLAMEQKIQELASAASAKPTPKAYLELGQLQQAAGEIPAARQSFEKALKLNPRFAEAKEALTSLPQEQTP